MRTDRVAFWTLIVVWAALALKAIDTVMTAVAMEKLNTYDFADYGGSWFDLYDDWIEIYVFLGRPVYFAAFVIWLIWIYRVSKNSYILRQRSLKFRPGWSVAWWFIPVANLIQPFRIIRELWQANASDEFVDNWKKTVVSSNVHIWWFCMMVSVLTGFVYDSSVRRGVSIAHVDILAALYIVSGLSAIVMWYLTTRLIREIEDGQYRLIKAAVT